jgi:transcriptional regulator with XRE-family HTH domain
MTQRIRELTQAGVSAKQIAAKLGVSPQQVYQVRYMDNKDKLKKRQELVSTWPKVPVKTEGARVPYDSVLYAPYAIATKPTFWQRVKAVFFPK